MKLTLLQYDSSDYRYQNKIKTVCPLSGLDPAVLGAQKEAAWWIRAGSQPAWEGVGAADKARAEIKVCVFASGPQTWRYKGHALYSSSRVLHSPPCATGQGLTKTNSFCILHHHCGR